MNQIFSKRKQQLAMTGGHPSRKRMKSDTLSDDVVVGENVETELSTSNVCGSSIAENLSTSNPPGAVGDDLYKEGNDELGTSTSLHLPEYSGIMEHCKLATFVLTCC